MNVRLTTVLPTIALALVVASCGGDATTKAQSGRSNPDIRGGQSPTTATGSELNTTATEVSSRTVGEFADALLAAGLCESRTDQQSRFDASTANDLIKKYAPNSVICDNPTPDGEGIMLSLVVSVWDSAKSLVLYDEAVRSIVYQGMDDAAVFRASCDAFGNKDFVSYQLDGPSYRVVLLDLGATGRDLEPYARKVRAAIGGVIKARRC